MISRVAESCFWLHRYLERMDNTARLLDTTRSFLLDNDLELPKRWRPVLAAAGEEARFVDLYGAEGAEDGERVEEFLTWDERCPSSIRSSAYWARENAVTIRETLSLEAWNALNSFSMWLNDGPGRRLYGRERTDFYGRVKESAQLVRGILDDTVLHEEPFDFMRLGMLLERVCQTARIVDVKYETLGPTSSGVAERAEELAQWLAILRSCAGTESFLKRGRPLSGIAVGEFLLLDPSFPRSIRHNVVRASNFLRRIRADHGIGRASAEHIAAMADWLRTLDRSALLGRGLHQTLTRIIEQTEQACLIVHDDFFDPGLPEPESMGQRQMQ